MKDFYFLSLSLSSSLLIVEMNSTIQNDPIRLLSSRYSHKIEDDDGKSFTMLTAKTKRKKESLSTLTCKRLELGSLYERGRSSEYEFDRSNV